MDEHHEQIISVLRELIDQEQDNPGRSLALRHAVLIVDDWYEASNLTEQMLEGIRS